MSRQIPGTHAPKVGRMICMTTRFLAPLVCVVLVALPSLRAEIHVDDPEMIAALEDYAEFAAAPPQANQSGEGVSPLALAIADFFRLNKEGSSSQPADE